MPEKFTILAVDDQSINFDLIRLALKEEYNYEFLTSGQACLEKVEAINPDLILLDVDMPEMDGYEVCRQLKLHNSANVSDIPVIFVSARDTLIEKLEGYEAGGEDFIVKPFESAELFKKVPIAINNKFQREKLKSDVSFATNTAMTAMTTSAELGNVINFLTHSYEMKNFEDLAQLLIDCLSQYDIKSLVRIQYKENVVSQDVSKVSRPLELALLEKVRDRGRIIDFGARTVVNYEHVSVLLKNMPIDDNEKYGRYKDVLALLIEGAEARVTGIISEQMIVKHETALTTLVENTRDALKNIGEKNKKNKNLNERIMVRLKAEISDSFIGLDLSEYQELNLMKIIGRATETAKSLFNDDMNEDAEIEKLVKNIENKLK